MGNGSKMAQKLWNPLKIAHNKIVDISVNDCVNVRRAIEI